MSEIIVKQYYLKEDQLVFESEPLKSIKFNKGFIDGIELSKGIKIFHYSGWWLFPKEWFDLSLTKEL